MKEQILKLRAEGYSYDNIAKTLGCSTATVWYHCTPAAKQKRHQLNRQKDKDWNRKIKEMFGGQCQVCGYSKCLGALEFHHINDDKEHTVMVVIKSSKTKAIEEAKKCILICSNCHREVHHNLLDVTLIKPNEPKF